MEVWRHARDSEEKKVGWRKITQKFFITPDGNEAEYTTYGSVTDHHAAVIAITPDMKVVVAEQFRPGPEMIMQELPGGNVEPGEDPMVAAMRELQEESGFESEDVTHLGSARKDAYMNAVWDFYLARNCQRVSEKNLDDGEFVQEKLISIPELIENAKRSRMTDGQAVLMAYDLLIELNEGRSHEKTD